VEQGIDRWIGTGRSNDIVDPEMIYMTDRSYVQVTQATYPGKVFWASGDHSAVTTSQQGVLISKWNEYPLMRHAWNYSPYGTSNLQYYIKRPSISGTSTICPGTTGSFTVANAPTGFTWDQSSNINSPTVSGNSATFTAKAGAANNGLGWVAIKLGSVEVAHRTVWVGAPLYTDMMNATFNSGCEGAGVYYAYINNMPPNLSLSTSYFDWMTHGSWTIVVHPHMRYNPGPSMQGIRITAPNPQQATVLGIRACNPCGCTEWEAAASLAPSNYYSIHAAPNPVGSTLTVSIEVDEAEYAYWNQRKASVHSGRAVWSSPVFELRLFNSYGFMVRKITSEKGIVSIDVSKLPNGFYFLHVYGDDSATPKVEKIIVNH
jgi:hypothetical protein